MPKLLQNAQHHLGNQSQELMDGIDAFHRLAKVGARTDAEVIWEEGPVRLLYYAGEGNSARQRVFWVPPLINKPYILDVMPDESVVSGLSGRRVASYVLDWGLPTGEGLDCGAYLTRYVLPALRFAHGHAASQLVISGYCMGGLLTLAVAQEVPELLSGIALFATPWAFDTDEHGLTAFVRSPEGKQWLGSLSDKPLVPAEVLQNFFYWRDPWSFERKFRRFAHLSVVKAGEEVETLAVRRKLAIEYWAHDGVDIESALLVEVPRDWAVENRPAHGNWMPLGAAVDPRRLRLPAFVALAHQDRIVPPESSEPLLEFFDDVTEIRPMTGHARMMLWGEQEKAVWRPFYNWLCSCD